MLARGATLFAIAAAFAFFSSGPAAADPAAPAFAAPVAYDTDWYPQDMKIADLNGDGVQDIVTANEGYGDVSVLLGNGDGTFSALPDTDVGPGASAVAVADLNGDGKLDLVVADLFAANIAILLGNGDGTFGAPSFISILGLQRGSSGVNHLAIGDMNADGAPDIAVSDSDGSISVLLGNGDGTLAAPAVYPTGFDNEWVALADLNGDGIPDLTSVSSDTVWVLLGNGDGTFKGAVAYAAGPSPASVAAGDLNGDAHPDLVVANWGQGTVSVLAGEGDGTFAAPVAYSIGTASNPKSVAVADLNGDGTPDLAVAVFDSSDAAVLLGNGGGTFSAPIEVDAGGTRGSSIAAADLNGDGAPDLVVTKGSLASLSVLLSASDRTPPTLSVSAEAAAAPYTEATWTNQDVTVTFACTDSGSGVESLTPSGPQTVTDDGVTTLDGSCADKAGNISTSSFAVWIDKDPPTIGWSDHPAAYALTDTVTITCSATDALSGISSSTCKDVSAPAWTLPGSNTLTATATDVAGNTGVGSTSFDVPVTYDGLCALTRRFATHSADAIPLCAMLAAAERAANRGNTKTAHTLVRVYTAALTHGNRLRGLSAADAQTLAQLADRL